MGDEVIKVLDKLGEKFGIAIDWTNENVMPYLKEVGERCVSYEMWTSVLWLVFGIILFVIGISFAIAMYRNGVKKYGSVDADEVMTYIFLCCLVAIPGLIFILFQMHDIIACTVFPEKILIEYIQDLM